MEGIPVLDLWDVVIEVLQREIINPGSGFKEAAGNCLRMNVEQLSNPDHVTTNASSSQCEAVVHPKPYTGSNPARQS